uniref:Uncharacterized protein n=1 Tax=Rhizophora mucronata TaxID=61149 RepID=A0A2P2QSS5_RHIMU
MYSAPLSRKKKTKRAIVQKKNNQQFCCHCMKSRIVSKITKKQFQLNHQFIPYNSSLSSHITSQ